MSRHMLLVIRFALILALPALLMNQKGLSQGISLTPDPNPGERIDDRDDDSGPAAEDDEVLERFAAMNDRFGLFGGEEYKQALLTEAAKQVALFGAQLPGGNPPLNMPEWRSLGPTTAKYLTNGVTLKVSDSGRIRRILQDPTDSETVYVLTSGGGLWKTMTFSHTNPDWKPLTDSLMSTSGGNMAFGRNPRTLYLGVGDPFDAVPSLSGVMAKSTDGGVTWSAFANLAGANNVRDVAVDTTAISDVVLVATDAGIYRSADGGVTYARVLSPSTPTCFFFAFHDGGFWSFAHTNAGWLVSTCDGRIFLSTDAGTTWAQTATFAGGGRSTLAVARSSDPVVYAFTGTLNGGSQLDLFRSSNGGLSWSALGVTAKTPTNPNTWQPNMNLMSGQAFYNQMILLDPADSNVIYLGGALATAKSTDAGATWTLISDWLPGVFSTLPYVHADCHAATMMSIKGQSTIAFGTDGGIFVSTDGGASFDFDKNDGIVSMLAQTVISSPKNPQSFISGMQDTGTRARLGSSSIFNQVTGGDGEGVGWSQANNLVTLATVQNGIVRRSPGLLPNTFGNWLNVSPPRFAGDVQLFFTPMATPSSITDPTGLIFFTASQRRVFVTIDGAQARTSWLVLASAGSRLPSNFIIRATWHGIALEAADPQFNRIAVAGAGGRIAFTLNGGTTWTVTPLIGVVPGFLGFLSSAAWTQNGGLYLSSDHPANGATRVLKSFDNGTTWQRADIGLPDAPVFHIIVDPRDTAGQSLFAATSFGVYNTIDGGLSWSRFGASLPAVRATGLWIAPDGGMLRVATYGRGLWQITP